MVVRKLHARSLSSHQAGFSLTELIMVIVIIGILGVGVTRFITASVGGYVDTAERQRLATAGLVAAEKISRHLREALPGSVRVKGDNQCIEFIPILAASHYLDIPITTAANSFQAVSARQPSALSGRVVVYPIDGSALYSPASPGPITTATASLPADPGEVTVTLGANHRFSSDSPSRRFYLTETPFAFCAEGSHIFRYRNYGFQANTSALPPAGSGVRKELLVTGVSNVGFRYAPATLVRNAVVNFSFDLSEGGDTVTIEQEATIRNIP